MIRKANAAPGERPPAMNAATIGVAAEAQTYVGTPTTANTTTSRPPGIAANGLPSRNGVASAAMPSPARIHGAVSSTTSKNPVRRPLTNRTITVGFGPVGSATDAAPDGAVVGVILPTIQPTANATTAAATTLITVIWVPSKGTETKTASRPNSGVATRKAMAAVGGTPFTTKVRYSGTTPQEQIGSGSPNAMPRIACTGALPRVIHAVEAAGRNAAIRPAMA